MYILRIITELTFTLGANVDYFSKDLLVIDRVKQLNSFIVDLRYSAFYYNKNQIYAYQLSRLHFHIVYNAQVVAKNWSRYDV